MNGPVDVLGVLDKARQTVRDIDGHRLNPYRLGRCVGSMGYDQTDVPSPYCNARSMRLYWHGVQYGLANGGQRARRDRIAAAAKPSGEG